MHRRTKKDPGHKMDWLSDTQLHDLFEYLKTHTYSQAQRKLAQAGVKISIAALYQWFYRYAAANSVRKFMESKASLGAAMKAGQLPSSQDAFDKAVAHYIQQEAVLTEKPELWLKAFTEFKKINFLERDLRLREQKFERLQRMEEESRKALTQGGTEAELIAKWKQILNFEDS